MDADVSRALVFDRAEQLRLVQTLAGMPWSGMVERRLDVDALDAQEVLAWLGELSDSLVCVAGDARRDREELQRWRMDIAAVRRVFGTDNDGAWEKQVSSVLGSPGRGDGGA